MTRDCWKLLLFVFLQANDVTVRLDAVIVDDPGIAEPPSLTGWHVNQSCFCFVVPDKGDRRPSRQSFGLPATLFPCIRPSRHDFRKQRDVGDVFSMFGDVLRPVTLSSSAPQPKSRGMLAWSRSRSSYRLMIWALAGRWALRAWPTVAADKLTGETGIVLYSQIRRPLSL